MDKNKIKGMFVTNEELDLMYDTINLYLDVITPHEWAEVEEEFGYDYNERVNKMNNLLEKITKRRKEDVNNENTRNENTTRA